MMNENIFNKVNIFLDIFSIFIGIVIIFALSKSIKKGNKINLYFSFLCLSVILFTLCDMTDWICRGTEPYWHIPVLSIGSFLFYFSQPMIFISYLFYLSEYLKPIKTPKIFYTISYILNIIYMIGLFLTPFFDLYYSISPDNVYHRGSLYYLTVVINGLYYLTLLILLIYVLKKLNTIEKISFYSFVFIPLFCELLQVFNYGLCSINIGLTLSEFIIFINIHIYLESSLYKQTQKSKIQDKSIAEIQDNTIIKLSNLVENRNITGGEHILRICKYVELLAKKTKKDGYYKEYLTDKIIDKIVKAAPMHDIGKILIPDKILNKPGKLTPEEYILIQKHVIDSEKIVDNIIGKDTDKEYIQITKDIAKYHHEKWNGTGYPEQLSEEEIPLPARIMAIADVFDALVSPRIYNNIVSIEYALQIIDEVKGTYFDPILVDEFLLLKDEIKEIIKLHGNKF